MRSFTITLPDHADDYESLFRRLLDESEDWGHVRIYKDDRLLLDQLWQALRASGRWK
jgi:hypothetical protein